MYYVFHLKEYWGPLVYISMDYYIHAWFHIRELLCGVFIFDFIDFVNFLTKQFCISKYKICK